MKFKTGGIIKYRSPWEGKTFIGIVTKKASTGYWVLWSDGRHKILQKRLLQYTEML
tara:strand:+ start:3414 stop:3581 length:168 start_codon:yes stop_codon:yes gene_type:complete